MLSSLGKWLPLLALSFGVSLQADQEISEQGEVAKQQCAPCGASKPQNGGSGPCKSKPCVKPCDPSKMEGVNPCKNEVLCGMNEGLKCCMARGAPNGYGVAFEFDFLWWRAENHGFSYGYEEKNTFFTGTTNVGNPDVGSPYNIGSIARVKGKWDPGFRLGFGWNTWYDRWDLFAEWTWYENNSHQTDQLGVAPGNVQGYYPLWPVAQSTPDYGPFERAHGQWKARLNAFDIELGRSYYLTRKVKMRPHWGLRGAILNQDFLSQFNLPVNPGTLLPLIVAQDMHAKNNWWGVGPRIGLQSDWELGWGFNILGKASTALMYGKSEATVKSVFLTPGAVNWTTSREFYDSFDELVPTVQLFMGLGWNGTFACEQVVWGVDVGWEANYWWNQFNLPVSMKGYLAPLPSIGNQPVSMEGVTFTTHLDF